MSTGIKRDALIIAPQWVGDAILSLPLIEQLRQEYDAVDVLAVPAVGPVYACCPSVRSVNLQPFAHGALQWTLRKSVAKDLRGRYQAAIVLPNSFKSALIAWLANIPIRRGALGEHRYIVLNQRREAVSKKASMLIQYLQLADHPLSANDIKPFDGHRPRLHIPEEVMRSVYGELAIDDHESGASKLMVLCPGAEYGPAKQWPAGHFARVASDWLTQSAAHRVAVLGSPKEKKLGQSILESITSAKERVFDLCGKTSLIQAFGWIKAADIVISNDSGLMHAAAALDVPTIALFGSTDPAHTPPHSRKAQVVRLSLSCSPCFQKVCPLGTTACLKDLMPSVITDKAKALIAAAADAQAAHDARPRASQ